MRAINHVTHMATTRVQEKSFAEFAWPEAVTKAKPIELRTRLNKLIAQKLRALDLGNVKRHPATTLRAPIHSS